MHKWRCCVSVRITMPKQLRLYAIQKGSNEKQHPVLAVLALRHSQFGQFGNVYALYPDGICFKQPIFMLLDCWIPSQYYLLIKRLHGRLLCYLHRYLIPLSFVDIFPYFAIFIWILCARWKIFFRSHFILLMGPLCFIMFLILPFWILLAFFFWFLTLPCGYIFFF